LLKVVRLAGGVAKTLEKKCTHFSKNSFAFFSVYFRFANETFTRYNKLDVKDSKFNSDAF
jgi:hypothetical protein